MRQPLSWLLPLILLIAAFSQNQAIAAHSPIVIAHRGASGYLPEHTLEAATMAYMQGADYIEQDVVISKDNIPIVLHDIHIDTVTDVAEKYPEKRRSDGRFYAIDFTLQELKKLRIFERKKTNGEQVYPNRYQGQAHFTIATLEEELELIQQLNRQLNKKVGFYVEVKAPSWHRSQGKDASVLTLAILRQHGLDRADSSIYVQCFDFKETKRLRNELRAQLKLVQLIGENDWNQSGTDYDYLKTPAGIKDIATVAQGIGPWIPQVLTRNNNHRLVSTGYSELAQQHGLQVHPYTYRVDDLVLESEQEELLNALFNTAKVNGLFTDFTDVVVKHLK